MNFNIRMGIPEMQKLWLDLQEKYRSGNIKKRKAEGKYNSWCSCMYDYSCII